MAKTSGKPPKKNSRLDSQAINEALGFMDKGNLVEFLYEEKDIKIQLKKQGANVFQTAAPAPSPAQVPASGRDSAAPVEDTANTIVIKSPMVGTFYRAPSPDSPPFINTGDMVDPGKTVCIIEAMKIMNEIKSEINGKVKEILVENAQAVEFNQPIMVIEK